MNTRRSTGSINNNSNNNNNKNNSSSSKRSLNNSLYGAALTTKTITPELHAINAKICRLVELHPCMYDRSCPTYMRKSYVEQAWEDISKKMNDTVDNCKERFRNIRTSFARSINVQRGSNRIKPYYLSEELEFLKRHITPGVPVPVKGRRSRDGNRRGDDNDDYDDNEDEHHAGALLHIKHSMSSDGSTDDSSEWVADEHAQSLASQTLDKPESELHSHSDDADQKPTNLQVQPIVTPQTCPFPPKKRRRLPADLMAKSNEVIANSAEAEDSPVDNKPAVMDFDDAFLQGIRPEMNLMNFHQKLYFKRRVYDLLGDIFESAEIANGQARSNGQSEAAPTSPTSLQHLGLFARSGTLQLPKLAPKPTSKEL
ncbi:probable serine/threonine-protein kinase DDB_G0271402 [Drosophila grimshawi]|uniref:GH10040 n=1 Tax=Drosophila grimshawi TaxID=7222 RepID=B4J066_DROGR|nr:probable serine/threonine-protein kinase DDB_G0271402 [Drosophila grimshawi]EDV94272.1 GH10040 [Drosophila grimshawi]EDV97859.1 GH17100 [Drosophila grimshawi]